MKKILSLIKACMSSDMNLFNLKNVKNRFANFAAITFLTGYMMLCFGFLAFIICEELSKVNLQYLILALAVFGTFLMTLFEGVYKSGPILFNCKDDQLLLSLPIKRSTVIFIRVFKFYIFELLFNSVFLVPMIIAYMLWAERITISFIITSIIVVLLVPIIPIAISCIVGAITSSISSNFKHKNLVTTVISMIFIMIIFAISYNIDNFLEYIIKNATSISDFISKLYYPAGVYVTLTLNFSFIKLLVFILIHIVIFIGLILLLNKYYFSINTRLKSVTTTTNVNVKELKYNNLSITKSLIKKEFRELFNTPVLVINALFGLVLFIIMTIVVMSKIDAFVDMINMFAESELSVDLIFQYTPLVVLGLLMFTSFMTSITSSLISLEGRKINILKSLPVEVKKILMAKVYTCLIITTPVLSLGTILLCIKLRVGIINSVLLLGISVILPLMSHLLGLVVNLKFPKLDYDNPAEVVKQSMSSFVSVMAGMLLLFACGFIIFNIIDKVSITVVILIPLVLFLVVDFVLYLILTNWGVKAFNKLSV